MSGFAMICTIIYMFRLRKWMERKLSVLIILWEL